MSDIDLNRLGRTMTAIERVDRVAVNLLMNNVVILNVLGVILNELDLPDGSEKVRAVADATYKSIEELYPGALHNESRH